MKIYLFFLIFTLTFSNESLSIITNYNRWRDQKLNLQLNQNLRKLTLLKSQGELQKEKLDFLYREAEYKDIIEKAQLKNDLIRAKIFYYYHKHQRRYYYYDFNYNIIYLN